MSEDYKKVTALLKDTSPYRGEQRVPVDEAVRRKSLLNDAFAQDIQLKKLTLILLFSFLAVETLAIFIYSLFQAIRFEGFHLEEWSFKLLVAATIAQITYMVQVAVKHLYPNK